MTALEMKTEFLVGYDKVASLAAPGYEDSEISLFLSQAQELFVKDRYSPRGKGKEGYEETERRRKDLASVTKPGTGVVSADQTDTLSSNSVLFDLPTDHWLTTIEWVVTDDNCDVNKNVVPVTHDEYLVQKDNPFRKPNNLRAWRLDASPLNGTRRHEIITDGSGITTYKFRYIKNLTDIDVTTGSEIDSELHPMTHREIVNIAVDIALENQQEPRFKSHMMLNQKAE